jgi:pantoate--beta-alanine ligase
LNVIRSLDELRQARALANEPVGLVPTMGYLHEGHLSLVRRARQECQTVAVSIFVNPAQFGPAEDLGAYPVDLDRDRALLEAENVDLIWIPTAEQVYPARFQTWVEVEALTKVLEGAHRPGHFRGVATVVAKLFNAFQPQRAYFGQKDAQQLAVIRQLVRDLNFPLEVVACPTVREEDGLAKSSRNSYLGTEERAAAPILFRALTSAREAFRSGYREASALRAVMREVLADETLVEVQYISVSDVATLEEREGEIDQALLSIAVTIGKTRLIDNLVIGKGEG